ncbi:hypothetical protein AB1Y20_012419 [Prymnesium parvum]|uniref:Armadillo repeat-containing protein 8 n=1 Tax=Prymnesium parvum TaxID=97485 RepID=A0AB34IJG5_PRYPA
MAERRPPRLCQACSRLVRPLKPCEAGTKLLHQLSQSSSHLLDPLRPRCHSCAHHFHCHFSPLLRQGWDSPLQHARAHLASLERAITRCWPTPSPPVPRGPPHAAPASAEAACVCGGDSSAVHKTSQDAPSAVHKASQDAPSTVLKASHREPPSPQREDGVGLSGAAVGSMDAAAVVGALERQAHDADLVYACCKRLRELCRDDDVGAQCDELGAAPAIARAMMLHAQHPEVQQQGCAAVINLCSAPRVGPRNRTAQSGVLEALVSTMQLQLAYPGIQEMAFIALQNVIIGSDENARMRKDRAIAAGALKAIVESLKLYERLPNMKEQGTLALRLLCSKDSGARAKAMAAGAKKEWLTSGGNFSSRLGIGTLLSSRKAKEKSK